MAKQVKGRSVPKGAPRELPDEGSFPPRGIGVIDVGSQVSYTPEWSDAHLVYLLFELIGERKENGDPFVVQQSYNYVLTTKSKLYKMLDAWGIDVDQENVDLEVECLNREAAVTIKHSESKSGKGTFANIAAVTKPTKGTKIGKAVSDLICIFLDDTFNEKEYNELSDYYKLKIASSPEGMELLGLNEKPTKGGKGKKVEDDEPARKGGKSAPVKKRR